MFMNRAATSRGAVAAGHGRPARAVLLLTMCRARSSTWVQAWAQKRQRPERLRPRHTGRCRHHRERPARAGVGRVSARTARGALVRATRRRPGLSPVRTSMGTRTPWPRQRAVSAMASPAHRLQRPATARCSTGSPTYHKSTKTWYAPLQQEPAQPGQPAEQGRLRVRGDPRLSTTSTWPVSRRSRSARPRCRRFRSMRSTAATTGRRRFSSRTTASRPAQSSSRLPTTRTRQPLTTITPVAYPVDNSPTLEPLTINGSGVHRRDPDRLLRVRERDHRTARR